MKGLMSILGFIGLRRMNRTFGLLGGDSMDLFQNNSTIGLNYCSSSAYPFVTSRFHLFPPKNVSLKSGKGNVVSFRVNGSYFFYCLINSCSSPFSQANLCLTLYS